MAGGFFERFAPAIAGLPSGQLTAAELQTSAFLLDHHADLAVYYIPFERLNPRARAALVGITPGLTQMSLAYEVARDGLCGGLDRQTILEQVDQAASFAGSMRVNLTSMLDQLGLPGLLGIENSEQLFGARADLLHSTSVLRNPVFVNGANYTGSTPPIATTPFLNRQVLETLGPELEQVPGAIIVPLGRSVEHALKQLIAAGMIAAERCCMGFPHPSGANGHRATQFAANRDKLATTLAAWFARTGLTTTANQVGGAEAIWSRIGSALATALTEEERRALAPHLHQLARTLSPSTSEKNERERFVWRPGDLKTIKNAPLEQPPQ